jgi:hypothetical protein
MRVGFKAMKPRAFLLVGVAALFLATGAAYQSASAKVDRACVRGETGKMFGHKQARRICNPANYVKPPRLGWRCEVGGDNEGDVVKLILGPGGAKRRRDAICE